MPSLLSVAGVCIVPLSTVRLTVWTVTKFPLLSLAVIVMFVVEAKLAGSSVLAADISIVTGRSWTVADANFPLLVTADILAIPAS